LYVVILMIELFGMFTQRSVDMVLVPKES